METNAEELGEFSEDGVVGGDGAGQSWSRRFAWTNLVTGKYIVVTEYVYPVNMLERFGDDEDRVEWDVENQSVIETYPSKDEYDPDEEAEDVEYGYNYPFDVPLNPNTEAFAKEAAQNWLCNHIQPWMYGELITDES